MNFFSLRADEVWRTLQEADFTSKYAANIFLTVYDAVQTAESAACVDVKVAEMVGYGLLFHREIHSRRKINVGRGGGGGQKRSYNGLQ